MARTKRADLLQKPVIGVDVGGTKILASVVMPTGEILSRYKKKTQSKKSDSDVLSRIFDCIHGAADEAEMPLDAMAAVGIGAPGALNPVTGVIHLAPNLGWKNMPLKQILEDRLALPVFLNNDVNVGVIGEHRMGSGVGMENIFGMFIGTGIGGGLILDDRLYQGSHFMAGEVGHIPVVENGPLCGCGRRGCLEAVAGRLGIVRQIEALVRKGRKSSLMDEAKGDIAKVKSRMLSKAWQNGDPVATKVLKSAAGYIGRAVATVVSILNPDAVILGGGIIEALDERFVNLIRKSAAAHAFPAMIEDTKILPAILGDDAVTVGAAFLARDQMLKK